VAGRRKTPCSRLATLATTACISRSRSLQPAPDRHAAHPINGQIYSYGYTPFDHNDPTYPNCTNGPPNPPSATLLTEPLNTSTGGNTDLRSPYLGFSPNSVFWTANGISTLQRLAIGLNKRLKHGLEVTGSYTLVAYPSTIKAGWACSTTATTASAAYRLRVFRLRSHPRSPHPSLLRTAQFSAKKSFAGKLVNGWAASSFWSSRVASRTNVYDFLGISRWSVLQRQ